MTPIPLKPLSPILHAAYTGLTDRDDDRLPATVRDEVIALTQARNHAPDDAVPYIDAQIVARTYWYVLRPDEIARATMRYRGWSVRHPLTIDQATLVLAAIGEAGYPIGGNGAPDYAALTDRQLPPTRGPERDCVLWSAALYWARAAAQAMTYVSLGDCRGYLPRPVQYDQPGSPNQQASLTLGPLVDRGGECRSHAYMRSHTRLLLLVRAEE